MPDNLPPKSSCCKIKASPEKFIRNLLPVRHVFFGLLRRKKLDVEFAFRQLERRHERRNVRVRRAVIGVAEDLLALLRDDEINQKLCGVRIGRIPGNGGHRQRAGRPKLVTISALHQPAQFDDSFDQPYLLKLRQ